MSSEQGITKELSLGEVVSKTFDLFRRDFLKYFLIFVAVEIIVGAATLLAYAVVKVPTVPVHPTDLSWLPGYLRALFGISVIIGITSLIVVPVGEGAAIKMAAAAVEGRPAELGASVRFALSKLVRLWVLGLVVAVVVLLGLVALVVPGVILAIMLCLALPALLLENVGVVASLSRSRELVSHRWGKTFAVFLVLGLIIVVIVVVVSLVVGAFGVAGRVVMDVLSAFYQPIIPIALVVYYFSNKARVAPQVVQPPSVSGFAPQVGMKFCPNCGTQLHAAATFCSNCGARQPTQS